MARHPSNTGYVQPYKSDGVQQTESATEFGRGTYTLASSSTYLFPIGGADSPVTSAHCQWDAAIVITSITVEDCNMHTTEVTDYSTTAGHWIDEDPTTAFVGVVGAGVSQTNGVVAATGGALGGCMFHIADNGARRLRLKVVVAGTGGEFRCAAWGKE